jgi:protein-S-isoprenylcysteine O-methyltransferase Ste14
MARETGSTIGKMLYGFVFVVVLPLLLIAWASLTKKRVTLPTFESLSIGLVIAVCGAAVMLFGMIAIYVYGGGFPMNAYPPLRFVTQGVYRLVSHPIYAGFSVLCIGVAIAWGSSSGLWLVSVVVILGCVALVEGFEKHDMHRRFGSDLPKPLTHFPADESATPGLADRLSVYVLALFPWLLLCEAVRVLGTPTDAAPVSFPFEANLPVYRWAEAAYALRYLFVLLAPLVARTRRDLREFAVFGLLSTCVLFLLFIAFPSSASMRPADAQGFWGSVLAWDRARIPHAVALLSSYTVWTLLAARVYAARMRTSAIIWFGLAFIIALSGIAGGTDTIVDVLIAGVVAWFAVRAQQVWQNTRELTETIANSWREWRLGPIRVINHGSYAGIGVFAGLSIVGTLVGPSHITAMLIIATSIIVTSALWAQFIEGSPSLLRPYGWYGGLLGAIIGGLLVMPIKEDPWLFLAAFSVAGPWVQSAGRVRCLVQGCCHGREARSMIGIRYTHPRSRVVKLASLGGVPIHATPLYSILWNIVVAVIMARLWLLQAQLSLILGVYLILGGLGRLVEESYRGEPQTKIYAGLRIYQWLAILSVLLGVFATMVNLPGAPVSQFAWRPVIAAGCFGAFTWFALGVDFPESTKRFARLA